MAPFESITADFQQLLIAIPTKIEPEPLDMYFDKSNRDALMQSIEHVAAATIGLHAARRSLPRSSFPADHGTDHSVSGYAENIEHNRETASKQQYAITSVTPAGLERQGLTESPKPGHLDEDERCGIRLSSRFSHPQFSKRLSLSGADEFPREVTNQGDMRNDDIAAEQDDVMSPDACPGGCRLHRCPSTSSSGSVESVDRRNREIHPDLLASIRRRSSEVCSRFWSKCCDPTNELKGQDPGPIQTSQV
jgi:hypothetical protein